jgi:hypothetical protein
VDVIRHAVYSDKLASAFLDNPGYKAMQIFLPGFWNYFVPVFDSENDVNIYLSVCISHEIVENRPIPNELGVTNIINFYKRATATRLSNRKE